MTTDKQRKMLEAAAKACRNTLLDDINMKYPAAGWNPLANPADTAEMCAKLAILTYNGKYHLVCEAKNFRHKEFFEDHDNSFLNRWMFAATRVAAMIGGHKE